MQVFPGIKTGIVAVVEDDAYSIISDRLKRLHMDIALPRHGDALVSAVALNLRARAQNAQKFSPVFETAAIFEANG